jgi:uncharacterized protein
MSRASSLHRLQTLDLELDRSRARLADIEAVLADTDPLARTREKLVEAEARLEAARSGARAIEHEVEAHTGKLARSEQSLYGGAVRNPKELEDLQNEVDSLNRYRPRLEDRLLEAMLALEEAELQARAAAEELERLEALRATQNRSLIEEAEVLRQAVMRLDTEREAALADVLPEDHEGYEQLRASRGPLAVALLKDDSCAACGLTPAHSARQAIRMGSDLVRCRQCGRILYAG